jgi:hypothetical protein
MPTRGHRLPVPIPPRHGGHWQASNRNLYLQRSSSSTQERAFLSLLELLNSHDRLIALYDDIPRRTTPADELEATRAISSPMIFFFNESEISGKKKTL